MPARAEGMHLLAACRWCRSSIPRPAQAIVIVVVKILGANGRAGSSPPRSHSTSLIIVPRAITRTIIITILIWRFLGLRGLLGRFLRGVGSGLFSAKLFR